MRVLVDTNVLFSALLFPKSVPAEALKHVAEEHELVLCDRNISELKDILLRKLHKKFCNIHTTRQRELLITMWIQIEYWQ